ncbi:hypothetical protein Lgra_2461 [Legionella gratiana]|uniref:DUF4239 domain-containing protein n=1 Tax=Legionella gratiana TaxID=45066 RepID=A0A378JEV1_9GAMM|nr:DUF4239 domain-containing protein [Legionella gratiana]KTD09226.1 hypothetical protein Lgra_2461 [Legionella gratiana]STX45521.1 Uncharacterised protein [Legionella gratiana]
MKFQLIALFFLIVFFAFILLFLYLGIYSAQRKAKNRKTSNNSGFQIVEGAVFTLLGLIVAFTFASANQRFDQRRYLIIEEANAIRTVYLRMDLVSSEIQKNLRQALKQYLFYQIANYQKISDFNTFILNHAKAQAVQKKIWNLAVKDCISKDNQYECSLLLSALNKMFDIANTRYENSYVHPPLIIFILLVGLALLGALLAGYNIGEKKDGSILHLVSYALVIAITIFIIIDLELPRIGFIRIDSFDTVLVQLYQEMA